MGLLYGIANKAILTQLTVGLQLGGGRCLARLPGPAQLVDPSANVLERRRRSTSARTPGVFRAVGWPRQRHGACCGGQHKQKGVIMLWTVVLILIALWAVGLVTSTTMGGLIHVLLVAALIVVLVRLIQGRRVA
jgi:Family of unknown function (DUF5670)